MKIRIKRKVGGGKGRERKGVTINQLLLNLGRDVDIDLLLLGLKLLMVQRKRTLVRLKESLLWGKIYLIPLILRKGQSESGI